MASREEYTGLALVQREELERMKAERDQLAADRRELIEALEKITGFDDPPRYRVDVNTAYSVAVGAVNIARTTLDKIKAREAGDGC